MYLIVAFLFGACTLSFMGILFSLFVAHNRRMMRGNYATFAVDSENRTNIRFDFLGTEVHLWVDAAGMYSIELEWMSPRHRIDVRLRRFSHEGIRRFGMEQVEMQDRELAKTLFVYANIEEEIVQQLFDRNAKKRLFDIVNFFGQSQFQLFIYSEKFIIKKRLDRNLGGKSKDLVRMAINLRNSMISAIEKSGETDDAILDDENITFIDVRDASAEPNAETECQICGQNLEVDLVACKSCKTLHHKDCWEYNGRCSTFGCLQRRYRIQNDVRS